MTSLASSPLARETRPRARRPQRRPQPRRTTGPATAASSSTSPGWTASRSTPTRHRLGRDRATAGSTRCHRRAGRATGLGDTGSVGIGGITLAGGIGFLVRKNGLTIDDLLAAEVVTADGEVVEASEDSEPDLFWAIRGGEGNFGVATRLQLRLHEISEIVGGMLILPASPEVITGFLEAAQAAPGGALDDRQRDAGAADALHPRGGARQAGDHGPARLRRPGRPGEEAIAPFRALAEPLRRHGAADALPGALRGPEQEARFASGTQLLRRLARAGGRRGDPRAAAAVDGAR